MAAERKHIDLRDRPELREIVAEAQSLKAPIALVENGEIQAIVEPRHRLPGDPGPLSEADLAEFRKTAGAWAGLIDGDELIRRIQEGRSAPPRELPDIE